MMNKGRHNESTNICYGRSGLESGSISAHECVALYWRVIERGHGLAKISIILQSCEVKVADCRCLMEFAA